MSENSASASASAPPPTAAATQAVATNEQSTPFSNNSKEAAEILRQADLLKQENQTMAQELEALRAHKAETDRLKAESDKRFADEREPQFKKYVEHLEAKKGGAIDDKQKGVLRAAFCKPEYKQDGDRMWQEFQDNVAVTASNKALEKELAAIKAERDRLLDTQSKLAQSMGPSATRASYANAVAVPEMAAVVNASATSGGVTRDTTGGGLALSEIMGATPSATEIECGFLQEYNFPTEFGVRASGAQGKSLRSSFPPAPEHRLLYDEKTGYRTHPGSMRWNAPHIFSNLANNRSYLDGDAIHASVVVRNAAGNFEQIVNDSSVCFFGSLVTTTC
jgi:hypothetical protein